jgi:hypothetical protein
MGGDDPVESVELQSRRRVKCTIKDSVHRSRLKTYWFVPLDRGRSFISSYHICQTRDRVARQKAKVRNVYLCSEHSSIIHVSNLNKLHYRLLMTYLYSETISPASRSIGDSWVESIVWRASWSGTCTIKYSFGRYRSKLTESIVNG